MKNQNIFEKFLNKSIVNSIYLRPVEPEEICSIIKNLKNKATSDTKVSVLKIVNKNSNFIGTLANVINSSF